jgi:hypothetical protein
MGGVRNISVEEDGGVRNTMFKNNGGLMIRVFG